MLISLVCDLKEATRFSYLLYSLCLGLVLVDWGKTVWPHTDMGKGRSIFIAFSDNYRYSPLSYAQTPRGGF